MGILYFIYKWLFNLIIEGYIYGFMFLIIVFKIILNLVGWVRML